MFFTAKLLSELLNLVSKYVATTWQCTKKVFLFLLLIKHWLKNEFTILVF